MAELDFKATPGYAGIMKLLRGKHASPVGHGPSPTRLWTSSSAWGSTWRWRRRASSTRTKCLTWASIAGHGGTTRGSCPLWWPSSPSWRRRAPLPWIIDIGDYHPNYYSQQRVGTAGNVRLAGWRRTTSSAVAVSGTVSRSRRSTGSVDIDTVTQRPLGRGTGVISFVGRRM